MAQDWGETASAGKFHGPHAGPYFGGNKSLNYNFGYSHMASHPDPRWTIHCNSMVPPCMHCCLLDHDTPTDRKLEILIADIMKAQIL